MSRIFTVLAGVVIFGALGFAQMTDASNQKQTKEHTLQGCVQQSGDEFMLQTGKRKDVELMSTEDLKPHVGHTVKVTGMWDRTADKDEAAGKGHEGHETAAGEATEHRGMKEHHFKVSKLEMVSESCTATTPKSK